MGATRKSWFFQKMIAEKREFDEKKREKKG
jgi:hypothetical protein